MKEILPFVKTRTDLEVIMLSEKPEKNNYCIISLMWNVKPTKIIEKDNIFVASEMWGWSVVELSEGGQKVQTFSYKTNKYWEYNVQHDDYT